MEKVTYEILELYQAISKVDKNKLLMLDLETDGFYGTIELVQFMQKCWDKAIIIDKPDPESLKDFLDTVTFVSHNIAYEISTIQKQTIGRWVPKSWEDTLLTSYLYFWGKKDGYSLDSCYKYTLGLDPYETQGLVKKDLQKYNWSERPLSEEALLYAATDVFYMPDLYEKTNSSKQASYKLLKHASDVCWDFQQNGLAINLKTTKEEIQINNLKLDVIDLPINPKSYPQVRQYLGTEQSDGKFLKEFALQGHTNSNAAAKVIAARSLRTLNSYLNKYLLAESEGRIYGLFSFTTVSGRGKSNNINLQQLARAHKKLFETPKGRTLVISDYSQLELRYSCILSGDNIMFKAFQEGKDLHQYTADMMGVTRQVAKTCNFNLLYGGSANMLRSIFIEEGILLDIAEVKKIKSAWHKSYKQLTQWQKIIINAWRTSTYEEKTRLGRRFTPRLFTDALNLPVQGGASDVAKLALHYVYKEIKESKVNYSSIALVNFVHDSIIFETDDNPEVYKPLSELIANCMQRAWFNLIKGYKLENLKMPVDVLVGTNWGKIEYGQVEPVYKYELEGSYHYKEN